MTKAVPSPAWTSKIFPDVRRAPKHGFIAAGGDFSVELLTEAYTHGIFPWPMPEEEFAWFSPDPRWVIPTNGWNPDRSFRRGVRLAQSKFRVVWNTRLPELLESCARSESDAVWLTPALQNGLLKLAKRGWIWSAEVLDSKDALVGGAYAVVTPKLVSAESMFHREADASKLALHAICERAREGGYPWVDVQTHSPHLERWGAGPVSRSKFVSSLT